MLPPYPRSFSIPETFGNTERLPLRSFLALSVKNSSMEKFWYSPLLIHKLFRYRKISVNRTESFPYEAFQYCETKKFWQKIVILPPSPLLIRKIHRHLKFCETQKGSSAKWFGTVEENSFDVKSWYPPLLSVTFLDARSFLKVGRVPLRNFSVVWDKTFSTENRDTLLQKVQKSVVELMFVKTMKFKFKTVVLFLTVCKSWIKCL